MLEQNDTYKKLLVRRDIVRFVLNMRTYEYVTAGKDKVDFRVPIYAIYMSKYSGWDERLKELIDRSKELNVNPNFLDEDLDGLASDVDELLTGLAETDREKVNRLRREIDYLGYCLNSTAESLCGELMRFYNYFCNVKSPLSHEVLTDAIVELLKMSKFDENAIEYQFLMSHDILEEWFYRCFDNYFFQPRMTFEEHKNNIIKLLTRSMEGNDFAALAVQKYIERYANKGYKMNLYMETLLIECTEQSVLYLNMLKALGNYPQILPCTAQEYIDELFMDFLNGSSRIVHTPGSLLNYKLDRLTRNNLVAGLVIPLICLYGKEIVSLIANKVALLPNHLEVAVCVSNHLKNNNSQSLAERFEKDYLEAASTLPDVRSAFVITMQKINNKNVHRK